MRSCPHCGGDLSRPKREARVFAENDLAYRAAEYLFAQIRRNNPTAKEPNWQAWARDFEAIYERDERDRDEVKRIIDWCQSDSFWRVNILSPRKLREKFDQLTIASKPRQPPPSSPRLPRIPNKIDQDD